METCNYAVWTEKVNPNTDSPIYLDPQRLLHLGAQRRTHCRTLPIKSLILY